MDLNVIKDSNFFWRSIKPLFSGKSKQKTNITLVDNEKVITEKEEVAETLHNYFIEAVQNLEIEKFTCEGEQEIQPDDDVTDDDVIEKILEKYKSHPSILKIRENVKVERKFKFDD